MVQICADGENENLDDQFNKIVQQLSEIDSKYLSTDDWDEKLRLIEERKPLKQCLDAIYAKLIDQDQNT